MAFNFYNFSSIGQQYKHSPNVYTYETLDTLTNVRKDGYFLDSRLELKINDIIMVAAIDAVLTLKVFSIDPLTILKATGKDYVEFHLPLQDQVIALDNDGITFTKITGMIIDKAQGFIDNEDSSMSKVNNDGRFLFVGTSDVQSDKAVDLTYSLFIDGQPALDQQTTSGITAAAKYANISITSIVDLNNGQTYDIRVKGDGTQNTTLTIKKLDVTLVEL